jgi:hypothetical protein
MSAERFHTGVLCRRRAIFSFPHDWCSVLDPGSVYRVCICSFSPVRNASHEWRRWRAHVSVKPCINISHDACIWPQWARWWSDRSSMQLRSYIDGYWWYSGYRVHRYSSLWKRRGPWSLDGHVSSQSIVAMLTVWLDRRKSSQAPLQPLLRCLVFVARCGKCSLGSGCCHV